MTHTIYHVQVVSSTGRKKDIGSYGKDTSAFGVVDRAISRLINKYKRSLTDMPCVNQQENDEGVHIFVKFSVKAHKFRKSVHAHHFLVTQEEMEMSRLKPIKTYQDVEMEW